MGKINLLKRLGQILTKKQKYFFIFLLFAGLCSAILEILGLSLIYPIASSIILKNESYFKIQEILFIKSILSDDYNIRNLQLFTSIATIYLIKNIFLFLIHYYQTSYVLKLNRTLSLRLFKAYTKKPLIFFLNFNSSIMIRNCTSLVSSFCQQLLPAILSLIVELILLFVMLIFLLNINFKITMYSIIFFSLLIFFIQFFTKNINYKNALIIKELWAEKVKIISETFASIIDIKFSKSQNEFYSSYDNNSITSNDKQLSSTMLTIFPRFLIEYLLILIILIGIYFLGSNQTDTQLNIGIMGIFFVACLRIYPSINKINQNINRIIFSKPALEEIENEINKSFTSNEINDPIIPFNNSIELKNVSFSYDGNNKIFKNLNFKINKYDKIAIFGPSGSGKSTFINLLSGLLNLSSGNMYVDKHYINSSNSNSWMKNIAYVSQDVSILDDTLINNITLKDKSPLDQNFLTNIINDVKLQDIPLDKKLGEKGSNISGGQKQRIGIARAIYLNSPVLIMDEATNSLDAETEQQILMNLIKRKITIIAVSHDKKVINNFKICYKIENKVISLIKNQ